MFAPEPFDGYCAYEGTALFPAVLTKLLFQPLLPGATVPENTGVASMLEAGFSAAVMLLMESKMAVTDSAEERTSSVSSIRRMKRPPRVIQP